MVHAMRIKNVKIIIIRGTDLGLKNIGKAKCLHEIVTNVRYP